jgi:hypothetical protein
VIVSTKRLTRRRDRLPEGAVGNAVDSDAAIARICDFPQWDAFVSIEVDDAVEALSLKGLKRFPIPVSAIDQPLEARRGRRDFDDARAKPCGTCLPVLPPPAGRTKGATRGGGSGRRELGKPHH